MTGDAAAGPWLLAFDGFDPAHEGVRESLCVTGNGYFATRGAAPEAAADGVHYPGTYVAGCYNRLVSHVEGRCREDESLVNAPNWLMLAFRPEGDGWFSPGAADLLDYHQELDLRRGVLTRQFRFRHPGNRCTRVTQRRLVHMGDPHLAALETTFVAENWAGPLEVRSGLDGQVVNGGVAEYHLLAGRHLVPVGAGAVDGETLDLEVETTQSKIRIAQAARTRVSCRGKHVRPPRRLLDEPSVAAHRFLIDLPEGEPVTVEKVVALFTSRDRAVSQCRVAARQKVADAASFDVLLATHEAAWSRLWARSGLVMGDNADGSSLVLNLHVFHLLQTVTPHTADLDASVPARGLHGEGYRGHIFWDELFVFPFLNLRFPELTRALLLYRHRRLEEARRAARRVGHTGAMFPWQSGSDGREETPPALWNERSGRWLTDRSRLQRHIGLAVAYNVWQYYQVTGDVEFLRFYGAELLVEIARFFASIAVYDPGLERYRIQGVMGPDEFHDGYPGAARPGLDDNTYTNVMAAWALCRALEVVDLLAGHHSEDLWDQLGLRPDELEGWDDISRRLRVVFHADGLLSQFDGYEALAELDLGPYRTVERHRGRLDLLLEAEGDTPNRYKASKQADVLMLFYLFSSDELVELFGHLGYRFDPATIPATIDYYLHRTTHGSTLSRVVHSWVSARSHRSRSWQLFVEALVSDIDDTQGGTTAEGIHLGAMAGTVDLLQRCYTGLEARGDTLWFNPRLPDELGSLCFEIGYRGQWLAIDIHHRRLRVAARPSAAPPVRIAVPGHAVELAAGDTWEFRPVSQPTDVGRVSTTEQGAADQMDTHMREQVRRDEAVEWYRRSDPEAAQWAAGYGPIEHSGETQARVFAMAEALKGRGEAGEQPFFEVLHAADRVASAAMWLVVHETYARNVYLDGRSLARDDFKPEPEGHTGGALNMVPAYVGYLAVNVITGLTRAWLMGQGHCVAAVDSANLLVGNATAAHTERYDLSDQGLSRYVRDFYSYRLGHDGRQDSPLGSHVNAHTAGGLAEGGYLGFAELQYVHIPLPGERLVVFLSDGAFEEQRGSDWAPRWWRAADCGLVAPIMIKNGRRIDQRTTMAQSGGVDWFARHLTLNGFDPIVFDGRDPAAFAWAIFEIEERSRAAAGAVEHGDAYPVRLPYGVAVAPKGAGFFGEGTNLAHNLPLPANPHLDGEAARQFNESVGRLHVPLDELREALAAFGGHHRTGRPRERDQPVAHRDVPVPVLPDLSSLPVPDDRRRPETWTRSSPMVALDAAFAGIVGANPQLRARVGNPDEMRSNRMAATLEALRFRVTDPEPGIPEDIHGSVITALNEEAVISAALANKGGINITVTYEAFGAKMHGALRQEVIFAEHCADAGRPQRWLSIPLVLTSHTWENAKNERSHQDPAMAEAMLGEPSHVSRVLFVPDANTAAVTLRGVYQTRGQLWTLVVPKTAGIPDLFSPAEAARLLEEGAMRLEWAGWDGGEQRLVLTAVGAYQLEEALRASRRLAERDIAHSVVYLLEPGRFRAPRSEGERAHLAPEALRHDLYPDGVPARVFVTHTRPEPLLGTLGPLHTGARHTAGLGFVNQGGTLTIPGLLFVNRCSWAHVVQAAASVLQIPAEHLLEKPELAALAGQRSPEGVILEPPGQRTGGLPG